MKMWLTSTSGPLKCSECLFDSKEYGNQIRINRAIYRCLECGWVMCRKHAIEHFGSTTCHNK